MAEKLPQGKDADELSKAVIRMLTPFIEHLLSTTMDNGSEFTRHKEIAKRLKTTVFFAHPYASWEKDPLRTLTSCSDGIYQERKILMITRNKALKFFRG